MKIKLVDKTGYVGTEQRNDWTNADKRTFKAIPMYASGRGWGAVQFACLVDDAPDFIEVDVISQSEPGYTYVSLKSHTNAKVAMWTQRPYVRKTDNKCAPNVNITDDVREVQELYAVHSPSKYPEDSEKEFWEKYYKDFITYEQFCRVNIIVPNKYLVE